MSLINSKKIGILFLEDFLARKKNESHLDFDQDSASYFILQMNNFQDLFDFNIINTGSSLKENGNKAFESLDKKISEISDIYSTDIHQEWKHIDYWIGITSEDIGKNHFMHHRKGNLSEKNITLITTKLWQKSYSPPSLFEYLTISIVYACVDFLAKDNGISMPKHQYVTKGCVSDFVAWKPHMRILISSPHYCSECQKEIKNLSNVLDKTSSNSINLETVLEQFFSKEWMGSPSKRDTPMFNLKKNYKFDVDMNSGFYKTRIERIKENVHDHSIEWSVITASGIIVAILTNILVK